MIISRWRWVKLTARQRKREPEYWWLTVETMEFKKVQTIEEANKWLYWLEYKEPSVRQIPFALRARIHNHMKKVVFR
jgi:hypothetical protein